MNPSSRSSTPEPWEEERDPRSGICDQGIPPPPSGGFPGPQMADGKTAARRTIAGSDQLCIRSFGRQEKKPRVR